MRESLSEAKCLVVVLFAFRSVPYIVPIFCKLKLERPQAIKCDSVNARRASKGNDMTNSVQTRIEEIIQPSSPTFQTTLTASSFHTIPTMLANTARTLLASTLVGSAFAAPANSNELDKRASSVITPKVMIVSMVSSQRPLVRPILTKSGAVRT